MAESEIGGPGQVFAVRSAFHELFEIRNFDTTIFSLGNRANRRALPLLEKLFGDTTEVGKLGKLGSAAADAIRTIGR